MDIQLLRILNNTTIQENVTTVKNAENDFRKLFEKITGGDLAREIRDNYNVTLNVGNVVDSNKAVTKMHHAVENVSETSELEDKYCSLCGSMIEEDGSCPLCGVPIFISGNGRSGNQKIAQAASSHVSVGGSE